MKYITLILITTQILLFSYCRKSSNDSSSITGKWKLDSVQLRMAYPDRIEYTTIYKPTTDYYDFRTDNKLYRLWMGTYDTISYQITTLNSKSLIQYPGSADTIIVLTEKSLIVKAPQGSDSKLFLSK